MGLKDIREASGGMLPEDRVARTMDLQEDIAAKLEILKANADRELELLPQGDKVPADAQAFKDELKRITDYVVKLQADTKIECDKYSNDVKYWAEYMTGIKKFSPWLAGAEKSAAEGLSKPSSLDEVKALDDKVKTFDKNCVNFRKLGVQESELKRGLERAELAEKNLKSIEEELETVGENMKQLEKSAEKALEREEKLVEKILSLQNKYKITEARFEYGEMNITKLNQRIDDIEDEIYREKLKIKKCSDEL